MTGADVVDLTRSLVRCESLSGRESPAAEAFEAALRDLPFDRVWRDTAGNVLAEIVRGDGPTLLLNGHLDVVPAGDAAGWPFPPFDGVVDGGSVWGRGACDMKGPLAAMAVAAAQAEGDGLRGRLVLSAVVQEEVGGLGARHLAATERADVVVVGEPSDLSLMLGHRGRVEVHATFPGRIAHAAKAELGENALERAARFVVALAGASMPSHPVVGRATATATQLRSWPVGGANVVPGRAELTVDYRSLPGEDMDAILARLRALDPGATIDVPAEPWRSEDGGAVMTLRRENGPYLLPPDHPAAVLARSTLCGALGRSVAVGTWWFATDAPHLALMGAPVLGFGPGDPELAHTQREHVRVEQLLDAVTGYRALIGAFLGGPT